MPWRPPSPTRRARSPPGIGRPDRIVGPGPVASGSRRRTDDGRGDRAVRASPSSLRVGPRAARRGEASIGVDPRQTRGPIMVRINAQRFDKGLTTAPAPATADRPAASSSLASSDGGPDRRFRRDAGGHPAAVADQDRRRQHHSVEDIDRVARSRRLRAVRRRQVWDAELRRRRRRDHRHRRRGERVHGKVPDHRASVSGSPTICGGPCTTHLQRLSIAEHNESRTGRPDHARDARYRQHPGTSSPRRCSASW